MVLSEFVDVLLSFHLIKVFISIKIQIMYVLSRVRKISDHVVQCNWYKICSLYYRVLDLNE